MWPDLFVVAILSFLIGLAFVKYLTVHPLRSDRFLFLTFLALFLSFYLILHNLHAKLLWILVVVEILCFLMGYWIATISVLNQKEQFTLPSITRSLNDPGLGHTAIIYLTHGEPETYNPICWIHQFREFDAQKIPFVPKFARPFFIYSLRKHYLQVGCSHHGRIHERMLHHLEMLYRQINDENTKFYLSFLDDIPHPDAALIQALNDGASRIIVAEIFVTISNHTAEGEHFIRQVMLQFPNLPVLFSGPLWDSAKLHSMFVHRVQNIRQNIPKNKIGILLIGHGQPDSWDKEFPTETAQEIEFRNRIRNLFVKDGYLEENLKLAWMEFKDPRPSEAIQDLLDQNIQAIFYFSAAISADAIHSQYDIPMMVAKSKIPPNITVVNLGAWNDDPDVISAIKEKIDLIENQVKITDNK